MTYFDGGLGRLFPGLAIVMACLLVWCPSALAQDDFSTEELTGMSLEELMDISVTVASNVTTDKRKQPVSVTTINKKQIGLSGARTLAEVIMTFVPGFFLVEDQDDVIAGFRGFSPDNNSKVLLLLNGQIMNTEWFWGPTDALLNGIALDYIQQIQVIRGPGSVTLGQGALLGVINIITEDPRTGESQIMLGLGDEDYQKGSAQVAFENGRLEGYFYFSSNDFEGQEVRQEGWAADRFDQGLFVFERDHHLKRSDSTMFFGNLKYGNFSADILKVEQKRDLYNFFRDREAVNQDLLNITARYEWEFGEADRLKLEANYAQDDFALFSHEGFVLGGTRENRQGLKALLNFNNLFDGNRLAVGMEFKTYESGRRNSDNNNFIVNAEATRFDDVNEKHQWVFAKDTDIFSMVLEDFYTLNQRVDLFGAFRFDDHTDWGSKVTPRIGAIFSLSTDATLRVSYQSGFRGATGVHYAGGFRLDGLLREENFDQIENNPTLVAFGNTNQPQVEPEEMQSFEASLNYRIGQHWHLESTGFYNIVENVIDVGVIFIDPADASIVGQNVGTDVAGDWNGFWFFKNNEGEIEQWGNESSLIYQHGGLNATLSHSLVRVIDADEDQFGGSMYIAGTPDDPKFKAFPEDITRLNLMWRVSPRVTLAYNHLYYWEWISPRNNSIDANHIANAGVDIDVYRGLSLNIQGKNLLNEDRLYPMNNNAGNEDLTDGTPALEETSVWFHLKYKF